MDTYEFDSQFSGTKTTLYHYRPTRNSSQALFIVKGLYGTHDPSGNSWDNDLIDILNDRHIFVVNTGRKVSGYERQDKFLGKTFEEECQDFEQAFLFAKNILGREILFSVAALSFGGTVLLGLPSILYEMEIVIFVGSGCGKNPTTSKPLLSTLFDTGTLLASMQKYSKSFIFLHGGKDVVVPIESQKMIFEAAKNAHVRSWIEYPLLGHKLEDASGESHLAKIVATHVPSFNH